MKYEELTDELKSKVDACKTPEELFALAKAEGHELTNEELEGVSGGWFDDRKCQCCGSTDIEVVPYKDPFYAEAKEQYHCTCRNCGYKWIEL